MLATHAPSLSFNDTAVAFASKSDAELRQMYALFAAMNNNTLVKAGGGMMKTALKWGLPVKFLIKKTIFEQFCGGETIQECLPVIEELGRYNIGTILDYSVEGEGSDKSYDHTRDEILATIDMAHRSTHIPFSVFKVTGLADSAILEKVQAKQTLTKRRASQLRPLQGAGRRHLRPRAPVWRARVCGCRGKLVSGNHRQAGL